jgi:hypothetical protein
VSDDWFETDRWPLEVAIAWLLYGDKKLSAPAAELAFARRQDPNR